MVKRFDVVLVVLDPTSGHEIQKTRPCLVVSPDEMNHYLGTVIVAPMTTKVTDLPFRVECRFRGKRGRIVLDQIRAIDKARLVRKLGEITDRRIRREVLSILTTMFLE
jgi:mRNA interferase MazF